MKNQIFLIAKKELTSVIRQNSLKILFTIIIVLLGFAVYGGHIAYKHQTAMVETAQKERRTEWLDQGHKHPHIAAHYGTFVFKQKTPLSLFDFGLDTYTGTSVYLEAHYPHEFMFRPAQGYGNMIRFGELSAALVLQLLLPLLIIFITFQTFTKERKTGTFKLLISQGTSIRSIYIGKILAYFVIILVIMVPFFIGLYTVGLNETNSSAMNDIGFRTLLLFLLYIGYLWIFTNFSVWISLKASSSRSALLTLLIFWVVTGIIIPKTSANLGETLHPLPSMKIYKEGIQHDIANGMAINESKEERLVRLKEKYLQEYNVDSIHKLPLNFSGIEMQEGEEYANKVYDFHEKKLHKKFELQNKTESLMSFIAPYIAIRNLSMAISATDWHSFNDFQRKTKNYRRHLIRTMNYDMAKNSRYGEFYEYKAGRNLWETISDFKYQALIVTETLKYYKIELASLALWFLAILFLTPSTFKSKMI
jgi:ABC-2 type transport system permease protein